MNKFFSIIFLLLITVGVNAQTRKFNSSTPVQYFAKQNRSVTDTLFPMSFVDTADGGTGCQLTSYSVDITNPLDSGYVSGTNIYGDLEKGQRYFITDYGFDTVTIIKLLAQFSIIHQSGSLGTAVGKIYRLNSMGQPDSLIATSIPVSIASISVIINGIAEFDFPTSVTVANGFLASIDFSSCLTDTLALVETEANCYDATGSAWEKWNDSTWHSFNNSWNFETDLSIFPIVSNGILLSENNFNFPKQFEIYPNPANEFIMINVTDEVINYSIYNSLGKICQYSNIGIMTQQKIDVSLFENGIYFLVASNKSLSKANSFVVFHQ